MLNEEGIYTDPGTALLTREGTTEECENCKVTQDQYNYLKERLKMQSHTIDNLLANRSLNPEM